MDTETPHSSTSAPVEKLQAQFNRAHISGKDFQEAKEYATELRDARQEVVRRALLVAAVISYARPFTQNEQQRETRATPAAPGRLLQGLTDPERQLHTKMLDLRNKAVAHSTFATRPLQRVEIHEFGFGVESTYFDILNQEVDVAMLEALCHKLYVACHLIKHELNAKLFQAQNAT